MGFVFSHSAAAQPAGGAPAADTRAGTAETELATEARLETILRLALARNPHIAEARQRVSLARRQTPIASRLPDPEFKYELWGAPLTRPYALDAAQAHLFGIRQSFPAPGTLAARERALDEQANALGESQRAREQDIVLRVKRAHADYYRADREYRVHLEHVALAQQILDLVRAAYQATVGTQQDVLRTMVELSRLHNDVIIVDRELKTARAMLNSLMGRAPEAPLGPPPDFDATSLRKDPAELAPRSSKPRPEVAAAERTVRASESNLEAARASARWPSFMAGVDYWYMPTFDDPHAYGGMVSVNLPWLSPRRREEVQAAEAELAAERSALASIENEARFELYEALNGLAAARELLAVIERNLLPQTQRSLEAAQAAYRGGQGDSLGLLDALRTSLEVRLDRERALARIAASLADVERARGGPLTDQVWSAR